MRIHLVDGTYELFRAYYGAPPQSSPAGLEVGATRALLHSLWGLVQYEHATHVAVAFDHVIESFRNLLFPDYKDGSGIDPILLAQFPLAERAARALGFVVWPMVEFEADDAMAAGAARYAADPRVEQVVLCTPDKDLAQCVSGRRVVMRDRRRRQTLDQTAVTQKFGVPPESIPDYLALVGDAADGVPGVRRWGAKSTAAVLAHYGHLESIPADADTWAVQVRGAAQLAAELRRAGDEVKLYRTLTTLRIDVPLVESVGDLEWRGAVEPTLGEFCRELGETALEVRIAKWAGNQF